jgi:hypothetical protein
MDLGIMRPTLLECFHESNHFQRAMFLCFHAALRDSPSTMGGSGSWIDRAMCGKKPKVRKNSTVFCKLLSEMHGVSPCANLPLTVFQWAPDVLQSGSTVTRALELIHRWKRDANQGPNVMNPWFFLPLLWAHYQSVCLYNANIYDIYGWFSYSNLHF